METRGVAEAALFGTAAGLVYDKLPQAGERTASGPLSVRIGRSAALGQSTHAP